MYVDFNTYFEDELNWGTRVDDILKMYGWRKIIKCPRCGKTMSIFDARFNPEYDIARCAECAIE